MNLTNNMFHYLVCVFLRWPLAEHCHVTRNCQTIFTGNERFQKIRIPRNPSHSLSRSVWKARQNNATSNNRIAMNTRRAKVKRMKTR